MPKLYVLNVPEFEGLIESARNKPNCTIRSVGQSYRCIESDRPIKFVRRRWALARPCGTGLSPVG